MEDKPRLSPKNDVEFRRFYKNLIDYILVNHLLHISGYSVKLIAEMKDESEFLEYQIALQYLESIGVVNLENFYVKTKRKKD